ADLQHRVGLQGLVFGGNHGLEIHAPDFQFVEPEACRHEPELRRILSQLEDALIPYPRARIEDKTLTATVHVRGMSAVDALDVERAIRGVLVGYETFSCRLGRMAFDIVPDTDWNKGQAIQLIRRRLGLEDALVLYAGDDISDEDAFRVLPEDITIKVGLEESAATYRYQTPQELWALMHALVLAVSPAV
ncbi:MAG: trehalose-phosphatase, partial [Acidobacteria bacterium]|nr:trehalose-phosphatase [Acidobacteriota bacterium]